MVEHRREGCGLPLEVSGCKPEQTPVFGSGLLCMRNRAPGFSAVAAATVLGWVLYDLAVVATTPEPLLVRTLLPGCIIAVGLGACVGFLWGVHRTLPWLTGLLTAAACTGPLAFAGRLSLVQIWFPRAVLLLMLGTAVAAWLAPRLRLPVLGTGLVMGAVAAAVAAAWQGHRTEHVWLVVVAAAFGCVSARVRRAGVRRLAVAAALVVPLVTVLVAAHQRMQLRRADEPLPAVAPAPGQPNLVLIVLDTVRADHLALYGYNRVTTPRLDAFVRKCATLHTEAYATSSWTLPSHASLFTGLYPSQHGAYHCRTKTPGNAALCTATHSQPLRPDVPTLAERLAARGYQTGAITANALFLQYPFGLDRGFSHYDDRWGPQVRPLLLLQLAGFVPHLGHWNHRSAETITDQALDWIAARASDRPFFLFLNYMDAHAPYLPPPPYNKAFGDQQPLDAYTPPMSMYSLLYDRKLLYLDEHVARLLSAMEAQGLLDNTFLIITADHGEGFGEHGFWWHGRTLYGEVLRVPLYVKPAGACRPGRSEKRLTGLDVHRLALRAAGLETDTAATDTGVIAEWQGASTLGSEDPDQDLLAWMKGDTKWIVSTKGTVEAYDLAHDPQEQRNLAVDQDQIDYAQAYATRWWTAHPPMVTSNRQPHEVGAETRERMRSLGYLDH
jgi:arylsulfatase A-like enzyme